MEYRVNKDTLKIELLTSKEEYAALSDQDKQTIKSNFLFSRSVGGWVSRCKYPHTTWAEQALKKLGAIKTDSVGELKSFEEMQQEKAERALNRAERYEGYADNATARAEQLQKPINDMHGDIAFFTQPIVNTSSGRAFGRRRSAMWAAYDKGFEEFKKSEYFKDRAETARRTADQTKHVDKAFCERRIKEADSALKKILRNIEYYETLAKRLENGEQIKKPFGDDLLTLDEISEWSERANDSAEIELSKKCYYTDILDSLGGIQFSKENVKPGYKVLVKRWNRTEEVIVKSVGTRNFKYNGNLSGNPWIFEESLANIIKIVSTETTTEEKPKHPFKVKENGNHAAIDTEIDECGDIKLIKDSSHKPKVAKFGTKSSIPLGLPTGILWTEGGRWTV